MKQFYSCALIIISSFIPLLATSQSYEDGPVPEFSAGMKFTGGEFRYGKYHFERNWPNFLGFQPTVRYDFPFRLFTVREQPFYLALTASTGVLYVPVKKQTYEDLNPTTGERFTYTTKSPFYMPFYFGFYNPGAFGLGVEAFYAKGLNKVDDIWGAKLISISINRSAFRIDAAYEVFLPVKRDEDPYYFFSLDFLWKLKKKSE